MMSTDLTALFCGVLWICFIFFIFACIDFIFKKGGDM